MDVTDPYRDLEASASSEEEVSLSAASETASLTDEEIKRTIQLLKQLVQATPTDYQSHIQLIGLLRQQGDVEELKEHREALASQFPLGENVWLEWIEDEEASILREEGRWSRTAYERIHNLFERATTDYLSIDLYLKWGDYVERMMVETMEAIQNNADQDCPAISFNDVRAFYESALTKTQHHLTRAGEVWSKYRAFEELLAGVLEDSTPASFVLRKRELFHREIAHPHVNLAKMYAEEYLPWEKSVEEENPAGASTTTSMNAMTSNHDQMINDGAWKEKIQADFEQSWLIVESRLKFEIQFSDLENMYSDNHTPDYTQLELVRDYIKFEKENLPSSQGRIVCLYERALAMYFLVLDLWQDYSLYLRKAPSMDAEVNSSQKNIISVLRRSIRNYPYSHVLWCQLMLSLESYSLITDTPAPYHQEITDTFEKSLQAGLSSGSELVLVYKQYIDYRVRSVANWSDDSETAAIIALFNSAKDFFATYLPDLLFELERYRATTYLTRFKSPELARQTYQASLARDPKNVSIWIAFIDFEIAQQMVDNARTLYQQAFSEDLETPEALWSAWLDFERFYGDLDSFSLAFDRVERKQKSHNLKLAKKAAEQDLAMAEWDEELGGRKTDSRALRRAGKPLHKQNAKGEFTPKKFAKGKQGEAVKLDKRQFQRHDDPSKASATRSQKESRAPHHNKQGGPGYQNGAHTKKPAPNYDPVTLHVSGIPADESLPSATISALFEEFGAVVGVRLPRNSAGQLKGFAFVQFAEAASSKMVKQAVRNEHRQFELVYGGQTYPLKVTAAVALKPAPKEAAKPVPGLEEFKHTVFVSNLSALTTVEKLEAMMQREGMEKPVSIRMPLDRKTGSSRCIAYLDYDEEDLVQKVSALLRDKMLDGRRLKAEPSKPTKARPATTDTATSHPDSHHTGSLEPSLVTSASVPATTFPKLLPRSVALKSRSHTAHTTPKPRFQFTPSSSSMDTS